MAKKCLYVATVVKTHIMQFHIPYLQMLKEEGWETAVAAKNDYENLEDCNIPYCDTYFDIDFARQPFSRKNIKAYKELKHILDTEHYDIVHCHTPVGGVLTRLAARKARKKGTRVIYTAHGFHFYKGAPFINWLIYFPIEYICALMTDTLITINQEDYRIAKKYMHAKEVVYVPGVGIDIKKFKTPVVSREQKRQELGINQEDYVLITVAELTKNKNHDVVLDAIRTIKENDDALFSVLQYLIVGNGVEMESIKRHAIENGIDNHIHFLGYRTDVADLYHCSDLFVFMSKREGLSRALMEAMASGLPCVVSNIRGNRDLMASYANKSCICDLENKESFVGALKKFIISDVYRDTVVKNNLEEIRNYDVNIVVERLKGIYSL